MRDPFGISKMLTPLKVYCKEQGFEFPITWLGKRDNILVPFAVPLHLHSDDRQSPYDGHVVFVLNDDVAGIDRVQAYLSQLTEPILLTVQLKKSSLRDKYEGVGMKPAPTRWSDNEGNEHEVYIKGDMDMETFGHLMEQMEYIGSNIIYKPKSVVRPNSL